MKVYLDYAATTPLIPEVFEEMLPVLKEDFGNPDSLHAAGRRAAQYVTDARDRIAGVLGVKSSEIYFTSGGTEADNWAVRAMGKGGAIVSPIEHAALLSAAPLRVLGESKFCGVGEDGIVRLSDFVGTVSEEVGLVCVMAVNNETGCVQPIEELAKATHARGAAFFSDCVQAACSQDLKKIASACEGISLSAHKIGGPKGVGALVVKKGVSLRPVIVGGEQERSLRGGTLNVAGIVGFARALELAQERREAFCVHTAHLRDFFEQKIIEALGSGITVDGKNRAPNVSHLTFERGGEALLNLLDLRGVMASGGAACSAHAALPSHVLTAMGRSPDEAKRGIRFSFGFETTEEETLFAAQTVIEALKG
ncbi:MAG: cysteine desulfurase [Clostridia bacterium]|nr:cysteine desulfurase [Clostridia bacterium]